MDFEKIFHGIAIRLFFYRFIIYFVYWLIFSYLSNFVTDGSQWSYSSKDYFKLITIPVVMAAVFVFFFNKKNKHNVQLQFKKLTALFPQCDESLILLIILSDVGYSKFEKSMKRQIWNMKIANIYARLPQKAWNEDEIREIISKQLDLAA